MIKRGQKIELSGINVESETIVIDQLDAKSGRLLGDRMLCAGAEVHLNGEGFVILGKVLSSSWQGELCLSIIDVEKVMPVMSSLGKLVSAVQRTTPRTSISDTPASPGLLRQEESAPVKIRQHETSL